MAKTVNIPDVILEEIIKKRKEGRLPQQFERQLFVYAIPTWFGYALAAFVAYFLFSTLTFFTAGNIAVGVASLGPMLASIFVGAMLLNKRRIAHTKVCKMVDRAKVKIYKVGSRHSINLPMDFVNDSGFCVVVG